MTDRRCPVRHPDLGPCIEPVDGHYREGRYNVHRYRPTPDDRYTKSPGPTDRALAALTVRQCANCGLRGSSVTGSQNGAPTHPECYVPDISQPQYRGALSDFLVAPPNARNVTPRADR